MANLPKIKRFGSVDMADLYAYKAGSHPKKAHVTAITSPYDGVSDTSFSSPFGTGTSSLGEDPNHPGQKTLQTSMTLAPELQTAGNTAMAGLNTNLSYLNRNPEDQVNFATSGQDPYYNILKKQAQQAFDQNLGRLRLNAFQGGGLNSTAAGAAYGNLAYNKDLLDQQNLLSSLQYGNQQSQQKAAVNLGAIGDLNNLVAPLGSAANANLLTSLNDQGRAQAATAAAQNQAEADYIKALNEYNQKKASGLASGIGSAIGAGIGLLGAIPTGGLSLAAIPALAGGALAGASTGANIGRSVSGNGSSGSVYVPQSGNNGGYNFGSPSGYAQPYSLTVPTSNLINMLGSGPYTHDIYSPNFAKLGGQQMATY